MVDGIADGFKEVEAAIRTKFLPALFGDDISEPDHFRKLLSLPVKHAGLAIPNPFVVSTDGMLGREATFFIRRLSLILAEKWHQPYSVVCGFIKACLSIAIARATHLCLRGSRIPTGQISNKRPLWEDRAGLGLYQ